MMNRLEKLVSPEIHMLGRSWSAYQVLGTTGFMMAVLMALTLVKLTGLSLWVLARIIIITVLTFFSLIVAGKFFTGKEQIVYYHHEIAVVFASSLLLKTLGEPILRYLDITILGIGLFLAFGRLGCFMVGCCHGKPHCWGIRYGEDHVLVGFTPQYVGVRLFPVQPVESIFVFCIVLVGITFILNGHQPGTALAWYTVTYGAGRFCFEFARGDPGRPYLWGFSQPQWISVLLVCLVTRAELSGYLHFYAWHAGVTICLLFTVIMVASRTSCQRSVKHKLLDHDQAKEIL